MNRKTGQNHTKLSVRICCGVLAAVCIVYVLLCAGTAVRMQRAVNTGSSARHIPEVQLSVNGGAYRPARLPLRLSGISAGSYIRVSFDIRTFYQNENIYVKTFYSPMRVYQDGILVYNSGDSGSYPSFMDDPPCSSALVVIDQKDRTSRMTVEYRMPHCRDYINIDPPLVGTNSAIRRTISMNAPYTMVLSLFLIVFGLSLLPVAVYRMIQSRSRTMLVWLSLFMINTGLWSFCENDLAEFFFQNASLLYLVSYGCLSLLLVPFLNFTLKTVAFHDKTPMYLLEVITLGFAAAAAMLQYTGIVQYAAMIRVLHAELITIILLAEIILIMESVRYRSPRSGLLASANGLLILFSVFELVNYYLFSSQWKNSSFFILGILIYIVMIVFVAVMDLHDRARLIKENEQLAFDMKMMRIRAGDYDRQYEIMKNMQKKIRMVRHDFKHQLIALQERIASGDSASAIDYINEIRDTVPQDEYHEYCRLRSVNAVISYYRTWGEHIGIGDITIELDMPDQLHHMNENELTLIMGNLLENACGACMQQDSGEKRFIHLRTRTQFEMLVITMDNSFNGRVIPDNRTGLFRTTKKDGSGIGLSSIRSIAYKYNGDVAFEPDTDARVFHSSVYLDY